MTYSPTVFLTLSHQIDLINFYSHSDYSNPAICILFIFKSMRRLRKVIYQDMLFIFGCCSYPVDWKVFGNVEIIFYGMKNKTMFTAIVAS